MPEPTIHIRPASRADIPALLDLERAAKTAAHWSPDAYADLFPADEQPPAVRRVAVVAATNATMCGFAVARVVAAEWEIENVVVTAAIRGKGVGRVLVLAITAAARFERAERVTLEVRESNHAARQLYETAGFAQVGLRPLYYREPEEAAILYELRFQ